MVMTICLETGCPELVPRGRCARHAHLNPPRWGEDPRSRHERGYGSAWEKLRRRVIAEERICRHCGTAEQLTVDHIRPKSRGGSDDRSNLRVLCGRCHCLKTRREAKRIVGAR